MARKIETIIVGGGPAGLAVSYYLNQSHRENFILEKAARPAHVWHDERWDSFTLVTPNWAFRIPGAEYQGSDPDGFIGRDEIARRFEVYVKKYSLPIAYQVRVTGVDAQGEEYRIDTDAGEWQARNVVIATGMYQTPRIPTFSKELPTEIHHLHSGAYRNPETLPPGSVLVVGSSQSGCQIAEELYQAGRTVFLSVSSTGRVPRRYRGLDIYRWMVLSGYLDRTPADLPSPAARFAGNPHLSGKSGGHTLNLHQFYRDGVRLLGRLNHVQDGKIFLAPDLKENLKKADQVESTITHMVDAYIARSRNPAPLEILPVLRDGFEAPEVPDLDLRQNGITNVIWAMGYQFDFSLVHLPIFDDSGFPITEAGATRLPGLYFAGMPWLPMQKNGHLLGMGDVAQSIAARINRAR